MRKIYFSKFPKIKNTFKVDTRNVSKLTYAGGNYPPASSPID